MTWARDPGPRGGAVGRGWPLLAVLLSGCVVEAAAPVPVPELDRDVYVAEVEPILAFSCATLDCHGDAARPLRLYAADGLRREDALRGEPLTEEEVLWNLAALAGIDPSPSDVDAHLVLTMALHRDAGGLNHPVAVWASREDLGYVCVRAWLAGGRATAACEEELRSLDLSP